MSIDPQEWSDKRMEAGSDVEATQVHIDLIRAVIADEAAKAPQPKAAGDVPAVKGCISLEEAQESGCCRICGWSTRGPHGPENAVTLNYGKEFAHTRCLNSNNWIAAELSRRVAEVSADRDKWIERVGEHAAAMKVIAIERDSLRQQLAAAQAEVASHKEIADVLTKRIDGLREEVARLSRPVEGGLCKDLEDFAVEADRRHRYGSANMHRRAIEAIQSERNAREAAERERDELIAGLEAWQRDEFRIPRAECLTAPMLLKAFTAFRAEKGTVAK